MLENTFRGSVSKRNAKDMNTACCKVPSRKMSLLCNGYQG